MVKLSVEGFFVVGKGLFLLVVCGVYFDWILKQVNILEVSRSEVGFFDGNLLLYYDFMDVDELWLSFYQVNDNFVYNQEFGFDYFICLLEVGYICKIWEGFKLELSVVVN